MSFEPVPVLTTDEDQHHAKFVLLDSAYPDISLQISVHVTVNGTFEIGAMVHGNVPFTFQAENEQGELRPLRMHASNLLVENDPRF
jgi:hypothetical protein